MRACAAVRRCSPSSASPGALSSPLAVAKPLALGVYVPDASENIRLVDRFAKEVGRKPAIVLTFKDWGSLPFDRAELGSIWRRGALPLVTWEPWKSRGSGFPLRGIANGDFDRYLRRAAGSARLWKRPLFVRFAHEMNGTWFPWGRGNGDTPRDYRKAWKHIVNLFRFHGATNVRWVWSPNEDSGGSHQFGPYYPGDEWVDWVAMDGFAFGGTVGWPSFTTLFGSTYNRLAKLTDRPMMIAETGVNEDGGDKAAWLLSALAEEAPKFPRLRAVTWFNDVDPNADFRIDSSPESLRAFRQAIQSPAFSGTRRELLSTPAKLSGGAVAPPEPEDGYGAPSFFERLKRELDERQGLAIALICLVAAAAAALVLRRKSRRLKTASSP